MASICEKKITTCISASCENPVFAGMESVGYVFNKSEIASFDYDQTNPNVITAINMATDSNDTAYVGYMVTQLGKQPFTGSNTTLVEGNIANVFTETVSFVVPDNSPAAAMLLDGIANGKFVFVLQNEYTGSDGRGSWQVYGGKKGLVCTAMEHDSYSEDTEGGWSVTLTAERTPNSALFLEHKTNSAVDTAEYLKTITDDCE